MKNIRGFKDYRYFRYHDMPLLLVLGFAFRIIAYEMYIVVSKPFI